MPARGQPAIIEEPSPAPATATPAAEAGPGAPQPSATQTAATATATTTITATATLTITVTHTPPATATSGPTATPADFKPDVEHSVKPENHGLITYTVAAGDTVSGIARAFGLRPESIVWSNPDIQANPGALRIGQVLWIPPLDGAVHTVRAGDTLLGIAIQYSVTTEDIVNCYYNDVTEATILHIGDTLIIPNAARGPNGGSGTSKLQYASRPTAGAPVGSGTLIWPVTGRISQGYSAAHRAIDITGWTGRPIVAADAGFVVRCGWDSSGYGNVIVIDHGNGVQTLYAHLYNFQVQAGDAVKQGQQIATMGSTGRSTGPHLHFEVIVGGVQKPPLDYLPDL